jgi:hypothetical protein
MEAQTKTRYVGSLTALAADLAGVKDAAPVWKEGLIADHLHREFENDMARGKRYEVQSLAEICIKEARLVNEIEIDKNIELGVQAFISDIDNDTIACILIVEGTSLRFYFRRDEK